MAEAIGWSFYACGLPAPQGSKRGYYNGGRIQMVESSKYVAPWRNTVMTAGIGLPTLDGPLVVRMVFTLPRPQSARKKDRMPWRLPDLSKLARAVEDAITEVRGWTDDARVVDYQRLAKVWPGFDAEALPIPGVVVACAAISGLEDERDLSAATAQSVSECCAEIARRERVALL